MFERYREHYRHNPEGYWFKRKLYGWGWVPVKWQGWAVILAYIAAVFAFSLTLDAYASSQDVAFTFVLPLLILTALLITISVKKGEPPRWQWGFPKD